MRALLDRVINFRDRVVANPKFQHAAAKSPLTGWVARRQSRALFDLCAGFVYSQVLLACVRLRLFEFLIGGPQSVEAISHYASLSQDATRRLLDAAVSLNVLERRSGARYGLGILGAATVHNPAVLAMIEHHPLLYEDLDDPVALLRGEIAEPRLARFWAYGREPDGKTLTPRETEAYTALMAASQSIVAAAILDSYPVHRHRCLLDIGGGNGAFIVAAAKRAPNLAFLLFDLPSVASKASEHFAQHGFADRVRAHGGSFLSDPLPRGGDIATLVRVLLDHDDVSALTILKAARQALPDEGTLIVAEPLTDVRGVEPVAAAYFGFYILAMGRGRARSAKELSILMHSAGFARVRMLRSHSPLVTSVLVARCG